MQPAHALRKTFEKALDDADIDHDKKMVLEGNFSGTRAKHYTGQEWEEPRPLYAKAYPFDIGVQADPILREAAKREKPS